MPEPTFAEQLTLFGAEQLRRAALANPDNAGRRRELARIDAAQAVMGEMSEEDLAFSHSGLCQTCLPHARPSSDDLVWQRRSGRFHLVISPGVVINQDSRAVRVGVPYGTRARLIMIFLQTEGVRSRVVHLGRSMSAWIRSLGLPVTGGPRGTIGAIREQSLRIARCEFTLQWSGPVTRLDDGSKGTETIIKDQRLVSGLSLWQAADERGEGGWSATVELTPEFHEHLKEHAVPLHREAIAYLKQNALGLDLYTLFAYRLQRLREPVLLRWHVLHGQLGSETTPHKLAYKLRQVLPDVLSVYPDARVEVHRSGLRLLPSRPPIPKSSIGGFRLISRNPPQDGGTSPAMAGAGA